MNANGRSEEQYAEAKRLLEEIHYDLATGAAHIRRCCCCCLMGHIASSRVAHTEPARSSVRRYGK